MLPAQFGQLRVEFREFIRFEIPLALFLFVEFDVLSDRIRHLAVFRLARPTEDAADGLHNAIRCHVARSKRELDGNDIALRDLVDPATVPACKMLGQVTQFVLGTFGTVRSRPDAPYDISFE